MKQQWQIGGVVLWVAALLGGCGGGGGSSSSSPLDSLAGLAGNSGASPQQETPAPAAGQPQESQRVLAFFIQNVKDVLLNAPDDIAEPAGTVSSSYFFGDSDMEKDAGGVLRRIGEYLIDSETVTREFHADDYMATGRWESGVRLDPRAHDAAFFARYYEGVSTANTHFLAFRPLNSFPANATMTCDDGVFTAPTLDPGETGTPVLPIPTGSASLEFTSTGAKITSRVDASVDGKTVSRETNGRIDSVNPDQLLSPFGGNVIGLADGGHGQVLLVGRYSIDTATSLRYDGLMSYRCR